MIAKFKIKHFVLVLLAIVTTVASAQITNRIYTLGNSVTDGIKFDGFQSLANQKGNDHRFGRHMIPGSPLFLLYNSTANGFNESPYGFWPTAFKDYDWDCISFQPFDRDVLGSDGDFTTIEKWINYIKANRPSTSQLQTYIYSRYPRTPQGKDHLTSTKADWDNLWLGTYGAGGQIQEEKSYFINLLHTVRGANLLAKPTAMVPVGDVMYSLNNKMALGRLAGYTKIWDFYADGIHVNNVGSFTLGATFFATMYKQDPRGLTVPSQYGSINDAIRDTILQTVYEVVFKHPYSGTSLLDIVAPTGLTIAPKQNTLSFLQSYVLTTTIAPANASNKNVSWTSSNTSVASVDAKGKVIGVGTGVATITGTTNVGGFKDFAVVSVSGLTSFTSVPGILLGWDYADISLTSTGMNAAFANPGISTVGGASYSMIGSGLNLRDPRFVGTLMATEQNSPDLFSAVGSNEYFSFKIKPQDGKLINIDKVSFRPNSQDDAYAFVLMSSLKGFSTSQVLASFAGSNNNLVDLNITGHQNISQELEFRFYIIPVSTVAGNYSFIAIGARAGNDLQIEGAIVTPVDTEKPTSVSGLSVANINENGFYLSWNESTDNMIVSGYNVYLNGTKLNSQVLKQTNFQVTSLTSGTVCNVSVTAVDFVGNESIATTTQTITNRAPTAILTLDKTAGAAPFTINASAASSSDPDTGTGDFVLGFDFDFGDGSPIINANSAMHTYSTPGVYNVSLVVVDTRNLRSMSVSSLINVTTSGSDITPPSAPNSPTVINSQSSQVTIAWGSSTDNVSVLGYNVYLNGVKQNGNYIKNTQYILTNLVEAASYNVTVVAIDLSGNISSASTLTFTTNLKPVAAFTGTRVGNAPFALSLNASTSSDPDMGDFITDYFWTIDGVNLSGQILSYTLINPGLYPTKLQVKAQNGNLSTVVSFVVTVNSVTVSGISVAPSTANFPALQSLQLTAVVSPANATNKNIMWSSNNPSIVSVDATGRITGLQVGVTTITAATQQGGFMSHVPVTISSALNTVINSGTLLGWDFAGLDRNASTRSTTAGIVMSGVSTSNKSGTVSVSGVLRSDLNTDNGFGTNSSTLSQTLATALANDRYFSFWIEPQVGSRITINSVKFAAASQNVLRTFTLFSSIQGFNELNALGSYTTGSWANASTLAGIATPSHANLSGSVEFRIYFNTVDNTNTNEYDNINLGPYPGLDLLVEGSVNTPNDTQNPTAPGNLSVSGVTNTSMVIRWAESTDDIAVIGYNIYRNGTKLNASPLNALVYTITGLSQGTSYPVSVTAVDLINKESIASMATFMTNRNPMASITGMLTGTAPYTVMLSGVSSSDPDAGDAVSSYSWNFGNGANATGMGTTYTLASAGIYPVSLQVSDNRGGVSNVAVANITVTGGADVTAPTPPTNLVYNLITQNQIKVSWTASTDNDSITGYALSINGVSVGTTSGTAYTFVGLNANTDYTVSVLAFDAAGNSSTFAQLSTSTGIILGITNIGTTESKNTFVFPNPVQGKLLHLSNSESGYLYDLKGTKLLEFNNSAAINIESLVRGAYFIKLENNKYLKFIKE